jgi:hypothetical protein
MRILADNRWSRSASARIAVIAAAQVAPMATPTGHTARVKTVVYSVELLAFSPDGETLVTGGGSGDIPVRLWRIGAGEDWLIRGDSRASASLALAAGGSEADARIG